MLIKPRDYQAACTPALLKWFKDHEPEQSPCLELPTGAGKSVVIADFASQMVSHGKRVLVLCRQKELVEQNAERLSQMAPEVSVGVYCAGLDRKDTDQDVIFATVQSVIKSVHKIGKINCILVDEAHQIPAKSDSQYGQVFEKIRQYQPKCRMVGLTATPYRTTSGMIYGEGKMFHGCAYSVPLKRMLSEGHIVPWTLPDVTAVDVSHVPVRGAEYATEELSEAFIEKVQDNVAEIVALTGRRRRILIFAASVKHAEALSHEIRRRINTREMQDPQVVTGDTPAAQRDKLINWFKSDQGGAKVLVNVGVLTTGFDAPNVDCVVICRATKSAGLFYQILGRGMRKHPHKDDFLVLDFGGNFEEHGDPREDNFGRSEQDEKRVFCKNCEIYVLQEDCRCHKCGEVLNHKPCPACGSSVPSDWRKCKSKLDAEHLFSEECGFDFTALRCRRELPAGDKCLNIITKEDTFCTECQQAIERAIQEGKSLKNSCVKAETIWWKVTDVDYSVHVPKDEGKNPSLRVTYKCVREDWDDLLKKKVELNGRFMEWLCFEHEGFAKSKAIQWWGKHSNFACPDSVVEAREIILSGGARQAGMVMTQADGKWQRIVAHKFNAEKPSVFDLDLGDDCPF